MHPHTNFFASLIPHFKMLYNLGILSVVEVAALWFARSLPMLGGEGLIPVLVNSLGVLTVRSATVVTPM